MTDDLRERLDDLVPLLPAVPDHFEKVRGVVMRRRRRVAGGLAVAVAVLAVAVPLALSSPGRAMPSRHPAARGVRRCAGGSTSPARSGGRPAAASATSRVGRRALVLTSGRDVRDAPWVTQAHAGPDCSTDGWHSALSGAGARSGTSTVSAWATPRWTPWASLGAPSVAGGPEQTEYKGKLSRYRRGQPGSAR